MNERPKTTNEITTDSLRHKKVSLFSIRFFSSSNFNINILMVIHFIMFQLFQRFFDSMATFICILSVVVFTAFNQYI